MVVYAGQVLRVDQVTHETSATYLTVTDDDTLMGSAEAGTVWNLCGINTATPPVLDLRLITGTLLDGSAYSYDAFHFTARGKDFYILPSEIAPESVGAVATSTMDGTVTATPYLSLNLGADDLSLPAGRALVVSFTGGTATSSRIGTLAVSDDDSRIQFDGQNGAPNSETGLAAQVLLDDGHGAFGFNTTGPGQMVLVKVNYHGTTGDGTFEALRYTVPGTGGALVYYIPQTGSVDLTSVLSYTGESLLPGSANKIHYADFGITNALTLQTGAGGADYLTGSFVPDHLVGQNGNDTLVGGMGADKLEGGAGADVLHGGAQNDSLIGGDGNDALFGGNDRDSLVGGLGNDQLTGNWGNDSLYGGDGNDRLMAGSDNDLLYGGTGNDNLIGFDGNDTLTDGAGVDTLNGGTGADVFILVADGAIDHIVDFQDGIDHIQLGVAFSTLTITTLSAGHVRIDYTGEVLLVDDPTLHLTAADLTAADFV